MLIAPPLTVMDYIVLVTPGVIMGAIIAFPVLLLLQRLGLISKEWD
jgi:hypothetical protein